MATVTKRGDTYRIRVSVGYDAAGRQIVRSKTWKPAPGMTEKQIQKELERQKVLFEERIQSGQYLDATVKLSEFIDKWFEDYGKEHLKATTYKNYRDCMKRILPALGHIPINKLQPHHLIEFYDNLEEDGIRADIKYVPCEDFKQKLKERDIKQYKLAERANIAVGTVKACVQGRNVTAVTAQAVSKALEMPVSVLFPQRSEKKALAGATALYYHRVLSSILTTAVQWQTITSNPCSRVKPPRVEHKEAKYLDEYQAIHLIECLENEPLMYRAMITLLLFSGMRRGEMCGLTWDDIDFDSCIIDINKSSLYVSSKGTFDDSTKNASSRRVIKIPEQAIELLKQHKKAQTVERLKIGDKWIDSGKVFTQWNGKPVHPDTVSGWFHDFIKRNDLPPITVHSLRHTNATLLIASGTNLETVSKRLGHANIITTGVVYTHSIKTADELAADTLQDILKPTKAKKA